MPIRRIPSKDWEVESLLRMFFNFPLKVCSSVDDNRIRKTSSVQNMFEVPVIDLDYMGTLHPSIPEHCVRCNAYVLGLMRDNPDTARYFYVFDDYFHESLLYRVLCYKPTLELVRCIYEAYPEALMEKNPYHKTPLHRACHFRASAEVIEYLISKDTQALRVQPNPLFLAMHPETSLRVIELLTKAYPEALTLPSDGIYTPLDYALIERLPPGVLQTLLKYYRSRKLKVATMEGGAPIGAQITALLATSIENVRALDVSKIRMSTDGLYKLLEGVYTNRELEELTLDISWIPLTPIVCETMELMLRSNIFLKKLTFRNGISNSVFAKALAEGMRTNASIEELTVEGGLSAESVADLFESLAENKTLKRLILNSNDEVDEGTDCWENVASLTNLEALSLSSCQAGPSLAIPLATLITNSSKLAFLNFRMNSIGDDGVTEIAKALSCKLSVQWIDMRGNQVGLSAAGALIESLENFNYTLSCIKVDGEASCERELERVRYLCQLNHAGRSLISGALKKQFVDLLSEHTENNASVLYGLLRHLPHVWSDST
jgi:hypothetical protein